MNNRDNNKRRRKAVKVRKAEGTEFFDSELDLVENNGRVTLPGVCNGPRHRMQVLIWLTATLLVAALFRRK